MSRAKHDEVKTFAHGTHTLVKIIEYSLPVIVGGLEIRELIHQEGIERLPEAVAHAIANPDLSTVLWKTALVIYFFSWVLGADSDTEMQADVYLAAPHGGRLAKKDAGVILGIAVGFAVLCIVSDSYRGFALALTVFWAGNVAAWRYMVRALKAAIRQSYVKYGKAGEYIDMERVRVVERYVDGRWQWWRFAVGGALVLGLDALVFFADLPPAYAQGAIFFFVMFVEAWIWIMRARTKLALSVLNDLSERYGEKLAASRA
jgi:hypothetical protein